MRLLLDTHVWIWALESPERLPDRVVTSLKDPATELWLSPISIWELLLLTDRGRVQIGVPAGQWVDEALRLFPLRDAPLTREVATASRLVDLPHPDPADRFIAATALVYGLTLVTADRRLLESDRYDSLAAG